MRGFLFSSALVFAIACGGNANHGVDVCSTTIPPPAACMTACNPQPNAPNTCPEGFHCDPDGKCNAECLQGSAGSGQCGDGFMCADDGTCIGSGACVGLGCSVTACAASGKMPTTITGTVFAPNGTLPLFGVDVYVPGVDPGSFPAGVQCTRCADGLPGNPIVQTTTDEMGNFTLAGIPDGPDIPVIISIGKWRREIKIPTVTPCMSMPVAAADTTLPKSMTDMTPNTTRVDMPQIAITTGNADTLECLVRRLGVADSEIGTNAGTGHVHLYSGNGVNTFDGGFAGGTGMIPSATPFWSSQTNLDNYDIVILSCEGEQNPDTKPQGAMDAMKAYADAGGRVFMSHWHNIWLEGATTGGGMGQAPQVWTGVAQFNDSGAAFFGDEDRIDEGGNPKGNSFATWMLNVGGSAMRDHIVIQGTSQNDATGKNTVNSISAMATQWVFWTGTTTPNNGQQAKMNPPQNFQFETPVEGAADAACGKVVFSDMHVSGNANGASYPSSCGGATDLSAQEKALAFMLFDIATCVGTIF